MKDFRYSCLIISSNIKYYSQVIHTQLKDNNIPFTPFMGCEYISKVGRFRFASPQSLKHHLVPYDAYDIILLAYLNITVEEHNIVQQYLADARAHKPDIIIEDFPADPNPLKLALLVSAARTIHKHVGGGKV